MRNRVFLMALVALLGVPLLGVTAEFVPTSEYLVIDISEGLQVGAVEYPIVELDEEPAGGWSDEYKSSKLVLKRVRRNSFMFGTPEGEAGRGPFDLDQEELLLEDDYYLSIYEVTASQYLYLTQFGYGGLSTVPQNFSNAPQTVLNDFFTQLNSGTSTVGFTLPDEVEWEFACRAGSDTPYSFGSDVAELGTYAVVGTGAPESVGSREPNSWGFYDMHGNVNEVTRAYTGTGLIMRGGRYSSQAAECRSGARMTVASGLYGGFRVALRVPTEYYNISVVGGLVDGLVSGSYTNGHVATLEAAAPAAGMRFSGWSGSVATVASVTSMTTTVVVAGSDIALVAEYEAAPFVLTVNGGSGSGSYVMGEVVTISAAAPDQHHIFMWHGDVVPANASSLTTTVVMPDRDASITATYTPRYYSLTVNGGTGSGEFYTNNQQVAISAPPPAEFHSFLWVGAVVAEQDSTNTFINIPGANTTITATYPALEYALSVEGGSGGGSYTNGAVVGITAGVPPSEFHVFDGWGGDVAQLDDPVAESTTMVIEGGRTNVVRALYRPLPAVRGEYLVVDLAGGVAEESQWYQDEEPAGGWGAEHREGLMVFRRVPGGSFVMGAPAAESGGGLNEQQHTVRLTRDFYLGIYEVTQEQWQRVAGGQPSAAGGVGYEHYPVESVSYEDIRGATVAANWPGSSEVDGESFIGVLRSRTGDVRFDLPTEAQWEYACRAGTTGAYGGDLDGMAIYSTNMLAKRTEPEAVGLMAPNAWGLFDMHGNVAELCLDWYGDYSGSAVDDPVGPQMGSMWRRVVRGGSFGSSAIECRSARRGNQEPTAKLSHAGLRVARSTGERYSFALLGGVGSAGGEYEAGTRFGISAVQAGVEMEFERWVVTPAAADLGSEFDAESRDSVITMPAASVVVSALYAGGGGYSELRVGSGSGSGTYTNGTVVEIVANPAAAYQQFAGWQGNISGVADPLAPSTTVVVGGGVVELRATYSMITTASAVGVPFVMELALGGEGSTYTARRLPGGVKLNRSTGVLSGVPTRSGRFDVEVSVRLADKSVRQEVVSIEVAPMPEMVVGSFNGYLVSGVGGVAGGATLKVTKNGRITARVVSAGKSYSFSARSWGWLSEGVYGVEMESRRGDYLLVSVDGATGEAEGEFRAAGLEGFDLVAVRNPYLNRRDSGYLGAVESLAKLQGNYTMGVPVVVAESLGGLDHAPGGSGYLTMTLRAKGRVKLAGRLADETKVSLSTVLLPQEDNGVVVLYQPLYSKRGAVAGLVEVRRGSAAPFDNTLEQAGGTEVVWEYPGKSRVLTDDSFAARCLVQGAYYARPHTFEPLLSGAVVQGQDLGWEVPLSFKGSGAVYLEKDGVVNPAAATLKIAAGSGVFSGRFNEGADSRRKFKFSGVVVVHPVEGVYGVGSYIVPASVAPYKLKESYWIGIGEP